MTIEQVREKMRQAEIRSQAAIYDAMDAKTEDEYKAAVDRAVKAANDYGAWYTVLASIS